MTKNTTSTKTVEEGEGEEGYQWNWNLNLQSLNLGWSVVPILPYPLTLWQIDYQNFLLKNRVPVASARQKRNSRYKNKVVLMTNWAPLKVCPVMTLCGWLDTKLPWLTLLKVFDHRRPYTSSFCCCFYLCENVVSLTDKVATISIGSHFQLDGSNVNIWAQSPEMRLLNTVNSLQLADLEKKNTKTTGEKHVGEMKLNYREGLEIRTGRIPGSRRSLEFYSHLLQV